jgi:hypothetical protein
MNEVEYKYFTHFIPKLSTVKLRYSRGCMATPEAAREGCKKDVFRGFFRRIFFALELTGSLVF